MPYAALLFVRAATHFFGSKFWCQKFAGTYNTSIMLPLDTKVTST